MEEENAVRTEIDNMDSPSCLNGKRQPQFKDTNKIPRKKAKSEHVHLPASDVRSNYHRIFEMIFNGCPKSVAAKNFRSICSEDCVFVSKSINNPFGPNYREVRGVSSMVEYVDAALEAIPDCIFAILDTKFFRKPQNESVIISSYTVNGRMIFTVDTLDTEDVEDIDSAISGLQVRSVRKPHLKLLIILKSSLPFRFVQMLYQGRCGSGDAQDISEAAQIICDNVGKSAAAAAIKKEKEEQLTTGRDDPLYSFVYQPTANEAAAAAAMIASTVSSRHSPVPAVPTAVPLPLPAPKIANTMPMDALTILSHSADGYTTGGTASVGVSLTNSGNVSPFNISSSAPPVPVPVARVAPFDYSLKFTSTGASLFEPSGDSDGEEPLENMGIHPVTSDGVSLSSAGRKSLSKHASNSTSTISMLANSSSERINQRILTTNHNTVTLGQPRPSAQGTTSPDMLSTSSSSVNLNNLCVTEMSTACKDFWQKQRSNVMIVKEQAKFCLKERVPLGKQIYKVKGTLTLTLNADKKVKRIELLNSFDTSMHR